MVLEFPCAVKLDFPFGYIELSMIRYGGYICVKDPHRVSFKFKILGAYVQNFV